MKKSKAIAAVLALFVTMPIWFYLLHFILKQANAGELQWFLFWIYIPVGIIAHICAAIAGDD